MTKVCILSKALVNRTVFDLPIYCALLQDTTILIFSVNIMALFLRSDNENKDDHNNSVI